MSFAAAAVIGGSVISGMMGSRASKRAAGEQAAASRAAIAEQRRQYDQTRADNEPWRATGMRALAGLEEKDAFKDFGAQDFQADPGYQFRMDEANKAMERSALARGGMMGGGFAKALQGRNQDLASQEYGNAFNRFNANRDFKRNHLGGLAGVGQQANSQVGAAGQNMANNVSNSMTDMGNAQAGGTMGSANAWGNAMGQGMNTWMQMQSMGKPSVMPKNNWAKDADGTTFNDYYMSK